MVEELEVGGKLVALGRQRKPRSGLSRVVCSLSGLYLTDGLITVA